MSWDHSGHRQRLKRALRENGLMSFSPHEVIELMLYTALPRRDVNDLAHETDARFKGVSGLLKASEEELVSSGLSPNTAGTLKAYCDCVNAYINSFANDKPGAVIISTRGELEAFIRRVYVPGKKVLALMSTAREVIFTRVSDGDILRFTAEKALIYDASRALIISGESVSEAEKTETKRLLKLLDVDVDYYIRGEDFMI